MDASKKIMIAVIIIIVLVLSFISVTLVQVIGYYKESGLDNYRDRVIMNEIIDEILTKEPSFMTPAFYRKRPKYDEDYAHLYVINNLDRNEDFRIEIKANGEMQNQTVITYQTTNLELKPGEKKMWPILFTEQAIGNEYSIEIFAGEEPYSTENFEVLPLPDIE